MAKLKFTNIFSRKTISSSISPFSETILVKKINNANHDDPQNEPMEMKILYSRLTHLCNARGVAVIQEQPIFFFSVSSQIQRDSMENKQSYE